MADRPPPERHHGTWTLNSDILLHILDLQVRFPHTPHLNTSALIVARRCSQVCRQWRTLILSTPLLWAKLIDLSALRDTSDDWKHEILHRTGNVPLWVSAFIAEKNRGYAFFLWLLDKHWERIQVLTLQFRLVTHGDPDPRWSAMQRPSPLLRSISIHISREGLPTTMITEPFTALDHIQPSVHLLDGGTPDLRHLTAFVFPPFTIRIQSPSLRSVKLTLLCSSKDLLPSLIAGLRTLTCLESLEVYDHRQVTDPPPPTSRGALLPRLSLIKFQGLWSAFTLILGQLRPAPGCSISIRTNAFIQPQTLPAAEGVINAYSQNFWDVHHSQYVEMRLDENHFELHPGPWRGSLHGIRSNFHATGSPYDYRIIYHKDVTPEFSICLVPGIPFENAIQRTLFALSCVPRDIFSSITHLHISKFSLESVNPDPVIQLVHALTCVEYLAVSLGFLQVIVKTLEALMANNGALYAHLPALRILKICYSESLEADDFAPFIEYATLRRSAGLAQLDTLDLVDMEAKVVTPLIASLSQAAVTVLYPVDEKRTVYRFRRVAP